MTLDSALRGIDEYSDDCDSPMNNPPDTSLVRLVCDEATAKRLSDLLSESFADTAAAVAAFEGTDGQWNVEVHFEEPPDEAAVRALVHDAAGTDSCVTLCELVSTIPTTIAGVAALVGYLREHVENGGETATTFTGKFDPANGEPLYLDIDAKLLETLEAAASSLAA